jgi:NADPH:quinone reductase-like Zn-dependent oxidoreductase
MKAWQLGPQGFGLHNLRLVDIEAQRPGPGQVLVRIHAVSLNYRDWLMVQGLYNPRQKLPLVPCSDGAGVVVAVGEGVVRWKPGDRVCAIFAQGWLCGPVTREKVSGTLGGPLDGMLRELAVFAENGLVGVPSHLSDAEAACLPCAGVTAWNAIVEQGGVKAGDIVLVQGTGGVSIFASQFAQMHGARVIVTSSSDDKLAIAVGELGVWQGINYVSTRDWEKRVRELAGGVGVDHVIEVGGAGTLARSLKAVRMGGTISVIGQLSGNTTEISLIPILMQNVRLQGVLVGSRETFENMNRAIAATGMRPVIDGRKRFLFETEVPEAFEVLSRGGHIGKVVVEVFSPSDQA